MRLTHKNLLVEVLRESPFGIDSFDLVAASASYAPGTTIIKFKGTEFKFMIHPLGYDFNMYNISFSIYAPTYPMAEVGGRNSDITQVIAHFKVWLKEHVKSYLDDKNAPDLWEEYKNGFKYLQVDDLQIDDSTHFSQDDQIRIKFAIEDLKGLIAEKFSTTVAQQQIIEAKLDYLIEALPRLSKTDWKGVAWSVIASVIIALSLDTERGKQLWELFMNVFRLIPLISGGV